MSTDNEYQIECLQAENKDTLDRTKIMHDVIGQVVEALDDIFSQYNDLRWLPIHQQTVLLQTEIRILGNTRIAEINQSITTIKQGA